eukprot:scaffold1309_cov117-Isochrysis_galbana.AAC.12
MEDPSRTESVAIAQDRGVQRVDEAQIRVVDANHLRTADGAVFVAAVEHIRARAFIHRRDKTTTDTAHTTTNNKNGRGHPMKRPLQGERNQGSAP